MPRKKKKVQMAKRVATAWIKSHLKEEHRFTVLGCDPTTFKLVKSLRNGKATLAGVSPFTDFGISVEGSDLTLWSCEHGKMIQLQNWFAQRGFETTGVW